MGTRHLTIVIKDNEPKIAQYGQWDGYPSGQGETILGFLLGADLEKFKSKLNELEFFGDSDADKKVLADIDNDSDWTENYPWLSRDMGGKILQCVYDDKVGSKLSNNYEFAGDGLMCEWVYVIDFDKNTFEVYKGFNNDKPLHKKERFYPLMENMDSNDKYYPVGLAKEYSLSNLPDMQMFFKFFDELSAEENAQYIRDNYSSNTTKTLKWINDFKSTHKGFPKVKDIVAQLEVYIEGEIIKEIEEDS